MNQKTKEKIYKDLTNARDEDLPDYLVEMIEDIRFDEFFQSCWCGEE